MLCVAPALLAALLFAAPARACDLDHAPSTRWSVERDAAGHAFLRTPCGERFFSIGVNVVDGGASGARLNRPHYEWQETAASLPEWEAATRARLVSWGFNSTGAWSLPPQELRLPGAINLELGRLARFHWFDPFDPGMGERLRETALRLTAPYRASPYRLGYFSDNEVGWWGGALFTFYSAKPAENYTKRRWLEALKRHYRGNWRRFVTDFVPPAGVEDWAGLLTAQAVTRLRPGGHGSDAVRQWTGIVAEHYYDLAARALHAADPDALFFGDRLPIYYDPVAVKAEARHVDVIATNYNVDSPEGWIAPYYFDGLRALSRGKPVLVSEWFYAARENRTGNRNNGHLMTVDTQAERAQGAAAAARNFAGIAELVGLHWFQYYDYPEGGRADREDYNFGLVDIRDRPYEALAAALGEANRALPPLHAAAPARPPLAGFSVPRAHIDPEHGSLVDWPKPQSLLPALKPAPGEAAFGEAYLSWSDQGLALATIGQDYYDLDLLAYDGDFPLSEAYRIELDVEAGAGARRFTLYFIPPRSKERDHPPMTARLCAGAAAERAPSACPAVPGAEALYFGADQPRIVGEALIPWSALGLDAPPASGRLKVEISASSWFRSRWMSLSGLPPAAGSARPGRWATVRLGR
ncbi:MAG TPA: hypothetical protein VEI03_05280 [Stellaceae bacterium]|nr:hypothetical protein [Stellaceae bacterium]